VARPTTKDIKIFYSYAEEDEALHKLLDTHMAGLRRQGLTSWHPHKISPGTERAEEIDRHLNAAHIILLLISADFIASYHCYDIEMERALERHRTGKARVIPILLRPVDLQENSFEGLEALPKNKQPVTEWANKDKAFVDIVCGIRSAIDDMAKQDSLPLHMDDSNNIKKKAMRAAFAAQTQHVENSLPTTNTSTKYDFHRELVIEYDLRTVIEDFKQPLLHGKSFGFTIAGEEPILHDYVIERMIQEFKREMQGEVFQVQLNLNHQDLLFYPLESLLEERIKIELKYHNKYVNHAHHLVTKHMQEHVILTVWNRDLPLQDIQKATTAFWQNFVQAISRHLCKYNLCFILILAHLPPETQPCELQGFIPLRLPQFDIQKDLPWFSRQLHKLNVPAHAKEYCLRRLSNLYPDPVLILRGMQDLARFLQGEYNEGRFKEVKVYSRRRSLQR
jgi:hypothetical protein